MFTGFFNAFCYLTAEALTGILMSETINEKTP